MGCGSKSLSATEAPLRFLASHRAAGHGGSVYNCTKAKWRGATKNTDANAAIKAGIIESESRLAYFSKFLANDASRKLEAQQLRFEVVEARAEALQRNTPNEVDVSFLHLAGVQLLKCRWLLRGLYAWAAFAFGVAETEDSASDKATTKACSACTFINKLGATKCEMCGGTAFKLEACSGPSLRSARRRTQRGGVERAAVARFRSPGGGRGGYDTWAHIVGQDGRQWLCTAERAVRRKRRRSARCRASHADPSSRTHPTSRPTPARTPHARTYARMHTHRRRARRATSASSCSR